MQKNNYVEFEKQNNLFLRALREDKDFKEIVDRQVLGSRDATVLVPQNVVLETCNIKISQNFVESHIAYCNPRNPLQFITLNGVRGVFSDFYDSLLVVAGPPKGEEQIKFFRDPLSLFGEGSIFEEIAKKRAAAQQEGTSANIPSIGDKIHILRVTEVELKGKPVKIMLISAPIIDTSLMDQEAATALAVSILRSSSASQISPSPAASPSITSTSSNSSNASSNNNNNNNAAATGSKQQADQNRVSSKINEILSLFKGQYTLFPEKVEAEEEAQQKRKKKQSQSKIDFRNFVEKMRHPSAVDLVKKIRVFVDSCNSSDDIEDLPQRVHQFLDQTEAAIAEHPLWKDATPKDIANARESLEKYIMTKLYDKVFSGNIDDLHLDVELNSRLNALSFIQPKHLEISPKIPRDPSFTVAMTELQRINNFKTPKDKIDCIARCCNILFKMLHRLNPTEAHGADSFLPVLIYLVLKANPPHLHSNVKYILDYRDPNKMVSEAGYHFTNLQSAVFFWQNADANSFNQIDKEEFEQSLRDNVPSQRQQDNTLKEEDLITPDPSPLPPNRTNSSMSAGEGSGGVSSLPLATLKKPTFEDDSELMSFSARGDSSFLSKENYARVRGDAAAAAASTSSDSSSSDDDEPLQRTASFITPPPAWSSNHTTTTTTTSTSTSSFSTSSAKAGSGTDETKQQQQQQQPAVTANNNNDNNKNNNDTERDALLTRLWHRLSNIVAENDSLVTNREQQKEKQGAAPPTTANQRLSEAVSVDDLRVGDLGLLFQEYKRLQKETERLRRFERDVNTLVAEFSANLSSTAAAAAVSSSSAPPVVPNTNSTSNQQQ